MKRGHGVPLVPPKRPFRERVPDQRYRNARETDSRRRRNRRGTPGGCGDRGVGHCGKWTIPPWMDRGERGQLPGRYGIRGVHLGCTDMEEMGSRGGRANQVLGGLCSVEGRALECLGKA